MQFKRMMSFMLIALLSVSLVSPSAIAADSEASINFTPGDGSPDVLDPTNPEDEYTPDPEDESDPQDAPTGESGPLTLDYVSSVAFGEQSIEAGTVTYDSTTLRPFVQVTDRRGTGSGWDVTASMSDFTDGEETTLPGATLTLSNGTVISNSVNPEDEDTPRPTPEGEIVLGADETPATVVTADEGEGLGSWITRWFSSEDETLNDNVTLTIPAGSATTGEHTATITWNLEAVPTPDTEPEPDL